MSVGQAVAGAAYVSAETGKLQASAARTKGDIVRISTGTTNGVNDDLTLADDTNVYRVAVWAQNAADNEVGEVYVKGTVTMTVPSGTYTAGHGLHIVDGAVADSTAAAEDASGEVANNDFAIIVVGGTSVTEVTATLYGVAITAQT